MSERDEGDMGPVLTATGLNHSAAVDTLLSLGGDLNETDKTGTTALCYAIVLGYEGVAKLLIDRGASPVGNPEEHGKNRPIHFAAVGNRIGIAKYLMSKGATLLDKGLSDGTPFRSAVIANSLEFAKWAASVEPLCLTQVDSNSMKIDVTAVETGSTSALKWLVAEGHTNLRSLVGQFGLNAFQMAARYGALELLKWFLSLGMAYNEKWSEQALTPLQLAAQEGKMAVIKLLLAQGADPISDVDQTGTSCLMWAARTGQVEGLKIFIEAGCPLESTDKNHFTPLMFTAHNGHVEALRYLVSIGAKLEARDDVGRSSLYLACAAGHLECAQALLSLGADPSVRSNDFNIMMCAARQGRLDVVKYLAQVFPQKALERDADGDSAVALALHNGHVETAQWLFDQPALGFSLQDPSLVNAVRLAAGNGQVDAVAYLVERGFPFNLPDDAGNTALTYAAHFGKCEVIRYLAQKGANLSSEIDGWQPAHVAARQGHLNAVKLLIELGVDKYAKLTTSGESLLHLACQSGKLDLVQFLLDLGLPHSEAAHRSAQTPMLNAAISGHLSIMQLLEDAGANWDVAASTGWTPAFYAAASGFLDILKGCYTRGLDLASSDSSGYTPLLVAAYNGEQSTLDFLIEEAKVDSKCRSTAGYDIFAIAVQGNRLELIKHMIEELNILPGDVVDDNEEAESTPNALSVVCARHGNVDAMRYLFSRGLVSLHLPKDDRSPIFEACVEGQMEMVKFLVRNGCSLRIRTGDYVTPLMFASQSNKMELVKWLLRKGCSPFDTDSTERIPASYAREQSEVEQLLSRLTSEAS